VLEAEREAFEFQLARAVCFAPTQDLREIIKELRRSMEPFF
jgi:hypothetical protein